MQEFQYSIYRAGVDPSEDPFLDSGTILQETPEEAAARVTLECFSKHESPEGCIVIIKVRDWEYEYHTRLNVTVQSMRYAKTS